MLDWGMVLDPVFLANAGNPQTSHPHPSSWLEVWHIRATRRGFIPWWSTPFFQMVRGSEKRQVEGKTDEMMIVYLVWQPDSEEQRTTTTTDDNNKYRFGVVLKSCAFLENSWILQLLEVEYKEHPSQIGSGSKDVLLFICFSMIHEIKWHKNLGQVTGSLPKCFARP